MGAASKKQGRHEFAVSELVKLKIRKEGRIMSLLVELLHMQRSWHRYIMYWYVTQPGTGLILPCLALIGECCTCVPLWSESCTVQVALCTELSL